MKMHSKIAKLRQKYGTAEVVILCIQRSQQIAVLLQPNQYLACQECKISCFLPQQLIQLKKKQLIKVPAQQQLVRQQMS